MRRYDIKCEEHGVHEVMGEPAEARAGLLVCLVCDEICPQVFLKPPYFVQDNLRLWRDGNGGRFSQALGAEMPESRKERDRLARAKGVEFVSKADFLADNKEAADAVAYHEHVNTGGARDPYTPAPQSGWKASA